MLQFFAPLKYLFPTIFGQGTQLNLSAAPKSHVHHESILAFNNAIDNANLSYCSHAKPTASTQ